MGQWLDYLREMNTVSVLLRMALAMLCGGLIGIERGRKHRPAGFRTYMLVCLGATLTILLSNYMTHMEQTAWHDIVTAAGKKGDVARFGAMVISGVGFLCGGIIIVTGHQEVKGLTTAAGLWATACMGLAIGAGFYECVAVALVLIFLCIRVLPKIEVALIDRARNLNLYVEIQDLENVSDVINCIREQGVHIYDVDIDRGKAYKDLNPSAVFSVRLAPGQHHTHLMTAISELETVTAIVEI